MIESFPSAAGLEGCSTARVRHESPRLRTVLIYRCDYDWLQKTANGFRMLAMLVAAVHEDLGVRTCQSP